MESTFTDQAVRDAERRQFVERQPGSVGTLTVDRAEHDRVCRQRDALLRALESAAKSLRAVGAHVPAGEAYDALESAAKE